MTLRRVIEHLKLRNWTAAAVLVAVVAAPASGEAVAATALSSREISQDLLEACDARAMPFGRYDASIEKSVQALTDLGVFSAQDFENVKIGFCGLRAVNGPAATASCARDTILLDSGYDASDKRIVRSATLAHEMKHVLQHRALIAKHGDGYCGSDLYPADWEWMEAEADAFGDAVAEMFFSGRAVVIRNDCPADVAVYLEADYPTSPREANLQLTTVAAGSVVPSRVRSLSKSFKFYAEQSSGHSYNNDWRGKTMAYRRVVGGETVGLRPITLTNAARSTGPFQLTLACEPSAH